MCDNEPTWVGVNTALPNRIIKLALEKFLFPELGSYSQIRFEVRYGSHKKSRVDFLLSDRAPARLTYLEVKSTTWASGRLALFPDAVTTRGQKHYYIWRQKNLTVTQDPRLQLDLFQNTVKFLFSSFL